jgi:hypothetical protein
MNAKIKPCPLCGGSPMDVRYGIGCQDCGLWLGKNTNIDRKGITYLEMWNKRIKNGEGKNETL